MKTEFGRDEWDYLHPLLQTLGSKVPLSPGGASSRTISGEFCAIAWHRTSRTLVLCTDHQGQEPVYYRSTPERFDCSFSLGALLQGIRWQSDVDLDWLAEFQAWLPQSSSGSAWLGIQRSSPGTALVVTSEGVTEHRLPQPPVPETDILSDDAIVRRAADLVDQSVATRMRKATLPFFQSSGGIDSAIMLESACRQFPNQPIHAFVGVPRLTNPNDGNWHSYVSEESRVRELASHLPNLLPVFFPERTVFDLPPPDRLFRGFAQPYRNISLLGAFSGLFDHAAQHGFDVRIHGGLGNAAISYHGRDRLQALLRQGRLVTLAREVAAFRPFIRCSFARAVYRLAVKPALPRGLANAIAKIYGRPAPHWSDGPCINPAVIQDQSFVSRMEAFIETLSAPDQRNDGKHTMRMILAAVPRLSHGAAMFADLFGVRSSSALGDADLIAFCSALPADQFFRNGQDRWLARRLLHHRGLHRVAEERMFGRQAVDLRRSLAQNHATVMATLETLRANSLARDLLDLPAMERRANMLAADGGVGDRLSDRDAVAGLARGLHTGQFLVWATAQRAQAAHTPPPATETAPTSGDGQAAV